MAMSSGTITIIAVIAVVLMLIFFKIIGKSMKWLLKILINSIAGFLILFLVNLVGGIFGIHLDFTLLNALVAGIFGVPGVVLLFLIKYVF